VTIDAILIAVHQPTENMLLLMIRTARLGKSAFGADR
jgi:hypothetical protein